MDKHSAIADMVKFAEQHRDNGAKERERAFEYYEGTMKDTPADEGRSKMVTRDVRSAVKKVLPSLMRTILGSDEVVEYLPQGEGDEPKAKQASDYINFVVMNECGAHEAVYDALFDALVVRNGILKWWYDNKTCVSVSEHSGLTDDALAQLAQSDEITVVEHTARAEIVEGPEGPVEMPVHDVKIRRTYQKGQIMAGSVPRERFLIHPDAVTLEDSPLVGEKTTVRRSDLVAMGYDREMVNTLPLSGDDDDEGRDERRDNFDGKTEAERANEEVDYYDLYVRVDMDDDGIAELRHMVFAGTVCEKHLLEDDECDEVQYCDIAVMEQPHQWEGVSLADDTMDIQRAKTVLFRQTLDNLYWQNNLQAIVQMGALDDPEGVFTPEFGKPIQVKQGFDVRQAVSYNVVPFVAKESFGMLEYMDAEAQDRTGVSDASAGLAPDALQNMTAKASAMIEQAGIGQTEMMVRTAARGLQRFFKGLLRLSIRHQDIPRTVRLRDEWVKIDPRDWNAEMDCRINTGLGAGTRERDMQMMMQVMAIQEKLIAGFGVDNPFVKPDNLSNTLEKLAESAGLKTPSLYFAQPTPEEIQKRQQAAAQQKSPEQMQMEADMQLEQAKMQAQAQLEQAKLQADMQKAEMQAQVARDKEKAQMEADLTVEQARIESDKAKQAAKLEADAILLDKKLAFEREKLAQERQDAIWKHQAESFTANQAAE